MTVLNRILLFCALTVLLMGSLHAQPISVSVIQDQTIYRLGLVGLSLLIQMLSATPLLEPLSSLIVERRGR